MKVITVITIKGNHDNIFVQDQRCFYKTFNMALQQK